MGVKVGKRKDKRLLATMKNDELYQLVNRGGKEKQKAITELTKRGLGPDNGWPTN